MPDTDTRPDAGSLPDSTQATGAVAFWIAYSPLLILFVLMAGGSLILFLIDVGDGNAKFVEESFAILTGVCLVIGCPTVLLFAYRRTLQQIPRPLLLLAGAGIWIALLWFIANFQAPMQW